MRGVDVLLSFPPLLFLLVLVTGRRHEHGGARGRRRRGAGAAASRGSSAPRRSSSRCAATSRRRSRAASGTLAILRREILPNIVAPILADVGLRFTCSIILVASVNFLGLGLQPPAADWALMITENRDVLDLNPWVDRSCRRR